MLFVFGGMLLVVQNSFAQIEGLVADKTKLGISNAVIIATDSTGKAIDTVKSDKRGGYAFKGLKPGKYNIEAKAPGFLLASYKNIVVTIAPEGTDDSDDTYYAVRVDITLAPVKASKQ
jgi:hypothetical protein